MLNLGKFPTQITYNALIHSPVSKYLQFLSKPRFAFSTHHHNFHAVLGKKPSGLCCNATKTKKKGGFSLKEKDGSDEFEEDFDDEFLDIEDDDEIEGDEDEDDEDEDEVDIPLQHMRKWLENKPSGFGEGKVYDTSVEDKLVEEIEQSRKAQLANINKLKNSPNGTISKKEVDKGPGQDEVRVRLMNLPKKKNIHRDLRLAFTGVPGIVKIVPLVSGNEKTRDPVCKGLAFVDFKKKDEAQRFIQNFSGTSICFGKIQKQIKCEMMNPILPKIAHDQSVDERNRTSQKTLLNSLQDQSVDAGLETDDSVLDSSEQSLTSEHDDEDERHESGQEGDDGEINGASTTSDSDLADELKIVEESAVDSSSLKNTRKPKTKEKKAASKQRKDKSPKLNILGSANKLKIREKEMLAGVFSKYGANFTSTVQEQSR